MLLVGVDPSNENMGDIYAVVHLLMALLLGVLGYFVRRLVRELDSISTEIQAHRLETTKDITDLKRTVEERTHPRWQKG